MKSQIGLLALIAVTGLQAQTTQKMTTGAFNDYALVYSLPQTELSVTVTATRTEQKAGQFVRYAEQYPNAPQPIGKDSVFWTIDGITVETASRPDPQEQYSIQLKPGSSVDFHLSDNGMLASVNTDPLPIKAKALTPATKPTVMKERVLTPLYTEEMLVPGSTAKMAKTALEQLHRLRQRRYDILIGDADPFADGESLRVTLESLLEQEEAFSRLFLGSTETETRTFTFHYIPSTQKFDDILFRFSDYYGIVDKSDLSGAPVQIRIRNTRENKTEETKQMPQGALAYRIPGEAAIEIVLDGKTLFNGTFTVAQFGTIYGIDPAMLTDKKSPVCATFDPETGAIRSLERMPKSKK